MNPFRSKAGTVARAHRPDYILALAIFVLLAFGLVMMYNINPALSKKLTGSVESSYYFKGQLLNIAVGLTVWFAVSKVYYQRWRQLAPYLMGAAVIAVLALFIPFLGDERNGATRWLNLGPASFQPAELLKIAMVVYLAAWFERRGRDIRSLSNGVLPFTAMLAGVALVVVGFQKDLGTGLVIIAASMSMLFISGVRLRHFAVLVAAGLAAGAASIVFASHRLHRLMTFLNPGSDPDGSGYHVSQALIGIGSGGLFGLGLGKSIQIYGYLPEASNDSIFAVIGEEFGLIGCLIVIALFGLLVQRGIKIAQGAPDLFSRMLAAGITLVFLAQATVNIAAMLAIIPLTGIPLPLISYGGSSLVAMLLMAGILLNISKYTVHEERYATSSERRGNRRPHLANPGNRRRPATAR